jgi:hypothetical protein
MVSLKCSLTCGLTLIVFSAPDFAQAAGHRISAAQAAPTRKCSILGFRSAKEYNSSTWPWYIYSTCMTKHRLRP